MAEPPPPYRKFDVAYDTITIGEEDQIIQRDTLCKFHRVMDVLKRLETARVALEGALKNESVDWAFEALKALGEMLAATRELKKELQME
ncbi:hypothetical protein ABW19_dt0204740 [Dactylella cylindrospora]|nr:hypothetical protein ABW19_dt0204740 [Dactylella cylindrospora]